MFYQPQNSVGNYAFECIRYENYNFSPHIHRHLELIFVREGEICLTIDGRQEQIAAGEYALILPNRIHEFHTEEHSLLDICVFSEDHIPVYAKEWRDKTAVSSRFRCRESVSSFAERELFLESPIPEWHLRVAALSAIAGEYHTQTEFTDSFPGSEQLMTQILNYIEQNHTENITLKGMAEELGYEPHYLSRYFHRYIPMHFSQYVNWCRIYTAQNLLNQTDLSVTEVALQSGFQSIRNFNRVYRELTGTTPTGLERRK